MDLLAERRREFISVSLKMDVVQSTLSWNCSVAGGLQREVLQMLALSLTPT